MSEPRNLSHQGIKCSFHRDLQVFFIQVQIASSTKMCLLRWKCTQCTAKFYTQKLLDMHVSVFHSKSNNIITHNETKINQASVESGFIEQKEREYSERKFAHQKLYSAPECIDENSCQNNNNYDSIENAHDTYIASTYPSAETVECYNTDDMMANECNDTDVNITPIEYLEQTLDKQDDAVYILVVQHKQMINDTQHERSTLNKLSMNEDPCQGEKEIFRPNIKWKHLNDMLTMTMKEPTLVIEGIQRNDVYDNGYNSISMVEFKCKRCDETFHTKHERRLHMESHAKDLRYFCSVCGRGFRKNQGLQLHMNVHAAGSNHQCPHCLNYYRTDRYLKEHMKLHIPEEYKFTCGVCNKSFAHKTAFKYHMHSHYNIVKFICNICGKGYRQKPSLEAHLRLHRGERPYVCQACGAAFRTKHTLGDHEKLHTDVRPFVCDWPDCGKAYTLKTQLRTHKLRHSGQKLHACTQPGCTKRFFYESHRVRHENTSHDAITETIACVKPSL